MKVNEHLKNSVILVAFSPIMLLCLGLLFLGTVARGVALLVMGIACPEKWQDAEDEFKNILP